MGGVAELMRPNDPVSIVFERKSVHTLEDGTVVTTSSREWFYRDSKGRVRIEDEIGFSAGTGTPLVHTVKVSDPTTLQVIFWSTGGHADRTYTLARSHMPPPMQPLPAEGSNTVVPRTPAGFRPDDPSLPHTERHAMGVDTVAGAQCDSLRYVTTYAAGSFGNDRPVTVESENCISQEFGMPIREMHSDPRTGRQTLTVISLTRQEPAASLFAPPPDYTEQGSGVPQRRP